MRELTGNGWADAVHSEEVGDCLDAVAAAAGQPFRLDYRLRRADGEYRWVTETANPTSGPNGTVSGYVCSLTDMTESKHAEARLASAEGDKAPFLAAVGYAIQIRLAPAADGLDLLAESIPQAKRRRVRAGVREQIEHACMLAGDFLDVSQIALDQIRLHFERSSLRAILEGVVASLRSTLESDGQELVAWLPAASVSVIADESRLIQAFTMLVRFASDCTPEGSKITIWHALIMDAVLIHIQVGGRGVTEDRLTGLFDLFVQREPSRRGAPPELGLALFTARRLVELHGGTVKVTNVESAGGLLLTGFQLPTTSDQTANRPPLGSL